MNLKVILASLILGSSSIVMAAPGVAATTTTIVRDHRDNPPVVAPVRTVGWNGGGHRLPPVYRPVTLASGLSFANKGRLAIDVGSQGRFATLQITAAGGRTVIRQVTVQFDNGQTQVMRNLGRTLSGNDSMTLDLEGGRRNIRRVVVTGNELNNGWQRERGAFTVTAS